MPTILKTHTRLLSSLLLASAAATGEASVPGAAALPALVTANAPLRLDGALETSLAPGARVRHVSRIPARKRPARAAAVRTTVQLLVVDGALVFGIRAWDDAPQQRQGALARRDKVGMDQDFIGIWLDPTGHGRAAQFVRINMAGVISDGMYRADEDSSDLGPDFPIDAAVKLFD